ncbi:hypothetical protein [uncultured Legionella sp.]|uniref:hypothetical protein n=1 Tax=uncultured Legionella sp. TaxID=210934 RepID=UPI002601E6E1|nr:hypothetical protein [uncultured Legionella sp.]
MNEIILKLLNEFYALKLPINPPIIKKIFETLPLDDEFHTPEYNEHYELLNRLRQLSQDFLASDSKLEMLHNRQRNFNNLSRQQADLTLKAKELQIKADDLNQKLLVTYKTLETKINDSLLARDPLAILLQHSEYHAMKARVAQYIEELNVVCKDIDSRKAKAKLALLTNLFNRLISELTALEVNCSIETATEQMQDIKEQIDSEVKVLQLHYDKALILQNLFAQQLSVEDLALKNAELDARGKQLVTEQETITSRINAFLLDEHIKERLLKEFNESNDKDVLMEQYRGTIDSAWDYVNPFAWASWSINLLTLNLDREKHEQEQTIVKLSVQYLELLKSQFINQTQQNDIIANKLLLENAKPKSEFISENPESDEMITHADMLIANTITLFNNLHSFTSIIELQEDSSETDFYLTLLLNLPLIADKLEKRVLASSKLETLLPLYSAIEKLRLENGFLAEHDVLLAPPKEAQREINELEKQAPRRNDFQSQLELCIDYQKDAQKFDQLTTILNEYIASLKQISIDLRQPANKVPSKGEIASLKNHLTTITETMESKLSQLHQLATQALHQPPVNEASVIKIPLDLNEKNNELIEAGLASNVFPTLSQNISLNPMEEQLVLQEKQPLEKADNSEEALSDASHSETSDSERHFLSETKEGSDVTTMELDTAISSALHMLEASEEYHDIYLSQESSEESEILAKATINSPPLSSPALTKSPKSTDLVPTPILLLMDEPLVLRKEHVPAISAGLSINTTTALKSPGIGRPELSNPKPKPVQPISSPSSDTSTTYSLSESSNSQSEDSELDYNNIQTPIQINSDNVIKWQSEIKGYILKREVDIQLWYKAVHAALQHPLTIESSCYKAAHLIRDILFELEHHNHNDVIRAYMRLCPDPARDIHKLLALKPSLLIIETLVDSDILLIDCPEQLKKYYRHYNKLKSAYPVEAELFIQAIQSLHIIQLYMELPEHDISTEQVPSLTNDPRYEPLKRHRGFLQLWELLEDLCRLVIGKITGQHEYEYVKRPCFFNTKSNQLLQEADTLIEDLRPGNTV